ncbi:MAG: hypothetical protein U9R36_05530 [Elusimicrobiota bacterium]|nr:hypothetical protein [Elusimicrobiota bacterium]
MELVLLKEYEEQLKSQGKNEKTVEIYIRRANTILEAIINILPDKVISAIIEEANIQESDGYHQELSTVLEGLREIVNKRSL